jgi:hypothetical protein
MYEWLSAARVGRGDCVAACTAQVFAPAAPPPPPGSLGPAPLRSYAGGRGVAAVAAPRAPASPPPPEALLPSPPGRRRWRIQGGGARRTEHALWSAPSLQRGRGGDVCPWRDPRAARVVAVAV